VHLVDNDPQASLSQGLLGSDEVRALEPERTITAIYRAKMPDPPVVILPTEIPGVDLLPGSWHLARFDVPWPYEAQWNLQQALAEFLVEARGGYDLVLLDCPPSLHLCSWAVLAASDALNVPMQPEDYGAQGIVDIQETLSRVSGLNPALRLLGYLLTMVCPRTRVHKHYQAKLRDVYGDAVFRVVIPLALDFKKALGYRKPVSIYNHRSASARVMRELAAEMDERLGRNVPVREMA
jgi:chromosome partitioning protein